ncbi:MAG: phytoene/squalene synthase family protein [Halobacteriales archaeon]
MDWCHEVVQDVSRTFALTVSELNPPMTDYICVGYLLCRIADTIEDASHIPPEERSRLLGRYQASLDAEQETTGASFTDNASAWVPEEPDDDWQLVQQTPRVLATFRSFDQTAREAMHPPIVEMIDGMRLFIDRYERHGGIRIQTLSELEDYSWYVAGTVGMLATELLVPVATDEQRRIMRESAEAYAHLLQFVNIATDARKDYQTENNVYLPAELLDEHGLEDPDLCEPSRAMDVGLAVRELAEHAETYVETAHSWIAAMPTDLGATRVGWAVPFLLAIATIRELKSRPEDVVLEGGIKVDRKEVYELLSRFHAGEPSIDALRATIRKRPLHDA